MFRRFLSTKLFKVIVVVAACGLLIFLNPKNFFNPVRSAIWSALYPFQKAAYLLSAKIGGAKDFISSISELKKENEVLIGENRKLIAENADLRDVKNQNNLLREQLELAPGEKFDLEAAYVVGQDPNGFGSWVEIDKGSNDGIREGMAVIISQGILVGKIGEVQSSSAQVVLITSPQSVVNAMISGSEAKGVVKGEYGLGILFQMIPQTDIVKAGDEVITSGLGKNIPRGLFIGNVRDARLSPDRLFQEAEIISPVQFSKLEVIFVIKNSK